MKALTKGVKPSVLTEKEGDWTAEYVGASTSEERKRKERWGHREIRVALREETGAKCAYCEARIEDVAYPNVEHIIPKASRPDLAHCWENLTSACSQCNIRKADYYQQDLTLLNPYEDDPREHLLFLGNLVAWRLGADRGEITVMRLGLNRMDLARSRLERVTAVLQMLERWHQSEGAKKLLLADAIRLDALEGEFTETVLAFLSACGFAQTGDDAGAA